MSASRLADRLFDVLASLRLAVVVILSLALTCTAATFYESKYGTPAAQREFYRTWWFALLLATLGVNIFCAMMKRYPWKKQHAGFLLAHVGIMTLLVGSLISLHFGLDSNMALFEGETSDRVALGEKALQVWMPGQAIHGSFPAEFETRPPRPGREQRFRVPGSEIVLVAEDYLAHAKVSEGFEEGPQGSPAVHFVLDNPFAKQDAWLLGGDPERGRLDFGPASVSFETAASAEEARRRLGGQTGQNLIRLVLGPDGTLGYAVSGKSGPVATGTVTPGTAFETPWMGMKVVVDRLIARAVPRREISPETPPEKDERRLQAVKLRLESPSGRSPSEWLLWTETRAVTFPGGTARVAFRAPELALPFRMTLLRFNSDKYPGSSMAATYESWVRVEDPERGVSEHHISMNNPLHYRGYIFFQASFVEGRPMMSIFSVARAPGLPLVYLGVSLIAAGVAWMFYLKPYLAKRQAAQALEARRQEQGAAETAAPSSSVPEVAR